MNMRTTTGKKILAVLLVVMVKHYGEKDPENHTAEAEWIQTTTTHEKKYVNCCGAIVIAQEAHEWENGICTECGYVCGHTGGTATCVEQAVCELCHEHYGEKDPENHTAEAEWIQTTTTHEKKYVNCCGAIVVAQEAHEWENGACTECGYVCGHTGGTATCVEQAVCELCHEHYGEKDPENHTHLEKVDEVPASVTAEGLCAHWRCDGCGRTFADASANTELSEEELILPKLAPEIIEGMNGEWMKNTNQGLSFRSNAAFADFLEVLVDGKLLDASQYDVQEGSIRVTLKPAFLETLSVGRHTLTVRSAGGEATAHFLIKAYQPGTGDGENLTLWIAVFAVGGTAALCMGLWLVLRRKRRN